MRFRGKAASPQVVAVSWRDAVLACVVPSTRLPSPHDLQGKERSYRGTL